MRVSRAHLPRLAAALLLVAAVVALRTLPVAEWLGELEAWTRANPVTGAVAYVVFSSAAIVALTPGWIPMTLAGVMFGLVPGLVYALIAVVGGATAAFLAGRTLARGWVERRIAGNRRLLALDDALGEQAFLIVMLTRAALVIPFNLLNYAYGLTRVHTGTYAAATAVGMVPVLGMYVYLGSLVQDVGQMLSGEAVTGAPPWWTAVIGAVAIATVVVSVRRTVLRKLERGAPIREPGARRVN